MPAPSLGHRSFSHCTSSVAPPNHSTVGLRFVSHTSLRHSRCLRFEKSKRIAHCAMSTAISDEHAAVHTKAKEWIGLDKDEATRSQIQSLLDNNDVQSLQELLGTRLEFGTAGLRGKVGPGFNRMNHVTVQQTSQGLCRYLQQQQIPQLENGVVIGFDARHDSRSFAQITAGVFLSQGVKVHLFGNVVPTPFVAAATTYLSCAAGVMITASHNPKEYNGYKVYWSNGCQIIPPHDTGIASAILSHPDLWTLPDPTTHPLVLDPTKVVTHWYYQRLSTTLCFRGVEENKGAARVVYTPLHGVGAQPVRKAFKVFGHPEPFVVPQQEVPDPDFPTVTFPNPEEGAGTWNLAFETASRLKAPLVLANDPDADRLAVAESTSPSCSTYRPFTGNEIGILLASWVWANVRSRWPEEPPSSFVMLASTVSSRMLSAMASKEGFQFRETLTGFKWLGNTAVQLEGEGLRPIFGFEEAIGFMFPDIMKDKDGVSAAAVFAEMAAALYQEGKTVEQQLRELYRKYGQYVYRSGYFISDQPSKTQAIFKRLRSEEGQVKALAGVPISGMRDLGTGIDTTQPDGKPILPWTAGDMMITWYLEGGGVLTLRASGTEPKLKYYLEVVGGDAEAAEKLAERLVKAVGEEVVRVEESGLRRPGH